MGNVTKKLTSYLQYSNTEKHKKVAQKVVTLQAHKIFRCTLEITIHQLAALAITFNTYIFIIYK